MSFYTILIQLWVQDDQIELFEANISMLDPIFNQVMMTKSEMITDPETRLKIQRAYNIMRGLLAGAATRNSFKLLFDWIYPQHFQMVNHCLSLFQNDDQIIRLSLKLLKDLADNNFNRYHFDNRSINGLITFKESAALMIGIMGQYDCFSEQGKPLKLNDIYLERYKFVKALVFIYEKFITGQYINFAICEYYNDSTFT